MLRLANTFILLISKIPFVLTLKCLDTPVFFNVKMFIIDPPEIQ